VVSRTFASRLAQARTARGWTKAELLRRVGREGRSNATGWEKGVVPDPDTLMGIALALGVSIDWLFGIDRAEGPSAPVDLAAVASGNPPVSWAGRALTPAERRRAFVVLHGLLEREERLGNFPVGWQERFTPDANEARDRATLIAAVPHRRPSRRRRGRADGVGEGDGGG
jgi:transcriptional regulator with XRE-family HTH domain